MSERIGDIGIAGVLARDEARFRALEREFRELVGAISLNGGSGKLVLTFAVDGGKQVAPGVRKMAIRLSSDVKIPKEKPDASVFFTLPDGGITASNPAQMDLDFEDAPKFGGKE